MAHRHHTLTALILALTISAAPGSPHPLGLNENHPYGRLTGDYVTPHVKWANPYYRGKIKALVIAPAWSQRETVELAQRVAIDYTAFMTRDFKQVMSANDGDPAANFFLAPVELVYQQLRVDLEKSCDVIIVGKLDWSALPSERRFELLKKVSEGTGLIYIDPPAGNHELDTVFSLHLQAEPAAAILADLPVANLPQFMKLKPEELVKTGVFGKGRVVALNYGDKVPAPGGEAYPALTPPWDATDPGGYPVIDAMPEMEFVPYEYYQALLAKCVLWAGRKEPECKIVSVSLPATLPWPVEQQAFAVKLSGVPAGAQVKAVVRDRWIYGLTYDLDAKKAQPDTSLKLTHLPAGSYFLDVWVQSAKGRQTFTWASRAFTVTADASVSQVSIEPRQINPGDPVNCQVTLSRALVAEEDLAVALWDNYGRQIFSQPLAATGTAASFSFQIPTPLTTMHVLRFQIDRDGQPVARKDFNFPVRSLRGRDDFNEIVWSGAENNFIPHLMLRKLASADQTLSIDVGWRKGAAARNIAFANLISTPYTARFGPLGAGPDHVVADGTGEGAAYGAMAGPGTLEGLKKWGEAQSEIYGPFGTFAWTHGDETLYSADPDLDWSPSALAVFRDYLKSQYPDLAALNREYKTAYNDWSEVMPLSFKDAQASKNYAPWVEHTMSSNIVFSDFYRKSGEALAVHDPGNRAGFDGGCGMQSPNDGGDWWQISRKIGILHTYGVDSAQLEIQRSYASKDQVSGMWYGTYGLSWSIGPNTVSFCHFFPWYTLFHGENTTWFWTMGAPGNLSGYAPDMTSLPFFESRTQALAKIRSGVGKLILDSTRNNDRIAIHQSELSRIADSLFAARATDWSSGILRAMVGFNKALEDAGFQYQYVSYEQVATGELLKQGYKVFIMPRSWAVSEAEAREITRFAEAGGLVIADVVPGILNGHGSPVEKSMLAHLFPDSKKGTVTVAGKGKGLLLGEALADYGAKHADMAGWKSWQNLWPAREELVTALKEHAGLTPLVSIVSAKGEAMPPTEVTRFTNGSITFVSLLREDFMYDQKAYDAVVTLPAKGHVYDMKEGRYLGQTHILKTSIARFAKLYAISPYKVKAVKIDASAKIKAGNGSNLEIAVVPAAKTQLQTHCLRLEVTSPRGKTLDFYAQNLLAREGSASASIPWALNDGPGKYTVTVRDVMSGVVGKRVIELE